MKKESSESKSHLPHTCQETKSPSPQPPSRSSCSGPPPSSRAPDGSPPTFALWTYQEQTSAARSLGDHPEGSQRTLGLPKNLQKGQESLALTVDGKHLREARWKGHLKIVTGHSLRGKGGEDRISFLSSKKYICFWLSLGFRVWFLFQWHFLGFSNSRLNHRMCPLCASGRASMGHEAQRCECIFSLH